MLLKLDHIAKSYGADTVLANATFDLHPGQRIGLVGSNGAGKSTLLKIIIGETDPDGGTLWYSPHVEWGYLPQVIATPPQKTVQGLVDDALKMVNALTDRMRQLEQAMADPAADLDAVMAEYGEVTERFELRGGYEIETRTAQVFDGLSLGHIDRARELATLSGGERSRCALAAMLVAAPDVLLLDEPTNHIDLAALTWLEDHLAAYRGGLLVVSHDRVFLNHVANRIVEIDAHTRQTNTFSGNYDAYVREKTLQRAQQQAEYEAQQEEIKALRQLVKSKAGGSNQRNIKTRDGDKFIKHFKDQTADKTQSRDLGAAREKLRRIEANPVPRPPQPLEIDPDFDPALLRGHLPLVASGLYKVYGERCVLNDVSFELDAGDRVALTGANGAGKSTLLRILVGEEVPDAGEVMIAPSVRLGYLPQEDHHFDPDATLFEAYCAGLEGSRESLKADLIGTDLFTYDQFHVPVGGLSAGQRRKLQIARLIAIRANLLLLDEPTNHVSFDVTEALEVALDVFPGPVIAISHDRRFLEAFAGKRWHLEGGDLHAV